MGKISICFFIGSFKAGGAENLLLQILHRLDSKRFDTCIAVFRKEGALLNDYLQLDIPIVEFRKTNVPSLVINFVKFVLLLKKRKTDIIHINLVGCYVFATFASILAGVRKRIVHWHGVYDPKRSDFWKVYVGSKLALRIIAISKRVKKDNCQVYRVPQKKVSVIYNAINAVNVCRTSHQFGNKEVIIGSVGKLDYKKGFDTLLQALSMVHNTFPNVVLEIVGDGPLKQQLYRYAIELDIADKVRFLGFLNNKAVIDKIAGWRVFVLASRREGFGMVLLEAMAMEKPIVATNVEGIPEVVKDGETGFLCSRDDAKQISERIIWFLENEPEAIAFGNRGRKRLDSMFSMDIAIEKLCELYEQI